MALLQRSGGWNGSVPAIEQWALVAFIRLYIRVFRLGVHKYRAPTRLTAQAFFVLRRFCVRTDGRKTYCPINGKIMTSLDGRAARDAGGPAGGKKWPKGRRRRRNTGRDASDGRPTGIDRARTVRAPVITRGAIGRKGQRQRLDDGTSGRQTRPLPRDRPVAGHVSGIWRSHGPARCCRFLQSPAPILAAGIAANERSFLCSRTPTQSADDVEWMGVGWLRKRRKSGQWRENDCRQAGRHHSCCC